MAINWDAIEEEYAGGDYLPYAEPGKYTVTCDGVEFKAAGSKGNYVMKFHFAEKDGVQFPTADHWLVKDKRNWRIKHCKDLFMVLGADESTAKKGCEAAESKNSFDDIVANYERGFKVLITKKKPELEIEVYPDGQYSRSEFTDRRVSMKRDEEKVADAIEDSEVIVLDTDIPF